MGKNMNGIPKWRYEKREEQAEVKAQRRINEIKQEIKDKISDIRTSMVQKIEDNLVSKYSVNEDDLEVQLNSTYSGWKLKAKIEYETPYFGNGTSSVTVTQKVKDIKNGYANSTFKVIEDEAKKIDELEDEKERRIKKQRENLENYKNYLLDTTGEKLIDYDPDTDWSERI